MVNFVGGEVNEGIVEDAFFDDAFGKLLSFREFMGLPMEGFENKILTLLRRLECREKGKDSALGGKKSSFLRSKFERITQARVLH